MSHRWFIVVLIGLSLVAAACGGSSSDPAEEAVRPGKELFEQRILGPNAGCITCHSRDPDTTLVGPSIAGVAVRASERVPGLTAASYLRQSITEPAAYVVEGFDDDKMPADWAEVLTAGELDALVEYLLTLR